MRWNGKQTIPYFMPKLPKNGKNDRTRRTAEIFKSHGGDDSFKKESVSDKQTRRQYWRGTRDKQSII